MAVGGYAALETLTQEEPPTPQETFLYLNPEGAMVPVWIVERGLVGEEARRAFEREHDLPPWGTSDRRRYAVERLLKLAPPLEVLRK